MSKNKQPDITGDQVQAAPTGRVKVSMEDYAKAAPGDQFKCAIVFAIRRQYPKATRIRVNTEEISFTLDDFRYHYPTDEATVEQVIRPLDTGGDLQPATVRLHDGYAVIRQFGDEDHLLAKRNQEAAKAAARARSNEPASSGYKRFH